MKSIVAASLASALLFTSPVQAQDAGEDSGGGEYIVVTSTRRSSLPGALVPQPPPVIGLRRMADSAVRDIEIVSDSREADMRKREVQAMLLDAIDRAKRDGLSLVTGQFELVEVNRTNWQDQFPGLAGKADTEDEDDDYDDYDDDNNQPKAAFDDNGNETRVRLKVKTRLDGSIDNAQAKIGSFAKTVPVTGRSQIEQKGGLALTIVKPEQYRDEIYRRIAAGAKHAVGFYGPDYGVDVSGLDDAIAWKQVSNTEVFLYIPYSFSVGK